MEKENVGVYKILSEGKTTQGLGNQNLFVILKALFHTSLLRI